jgi:leader peptidase (prepilin peptidase) / N-methyltransferase
VTAAAWTRAHPLGSLFAAALATAVLVRYGFTAAGQIAALASAALVVLSLIDIESRRLPNRIVLPAAALVLAARLLTAPQHSAAWIGAALGAAAFLLAFALAFPGGLGMGDVKLALLLVRDGRGALGRTMPFGPFLAFGAIATVLLLAP